MIPHTNGILIISSANSAWVPIWSDNNDSVRFVIRVWTINVRKVEASVFGCSSVNKGWVSRSLCRWLSKNGHSLMDDLHSVLPGPCYLFHSSLYDFCILLHSYCYLFHSSLSLPLGHLCLFTMHFFTKEPAYRRKRNSFNSS